MYRPDKELIRTFYKLLSWWSYFGKLLFRLLWQNHRKISLFQVQSAAVNQSNSTWKRHSSWRRRAELCEPVNPDTVFGFLTNLKLLQQVQNNNRVYFSGLMVERNVVGIHQEGKLLLFSVANEHKWTLYNQTRRNLNLCLVWMQQNSLHIGTVHSLVHKGLLWSPK